MFFENTNLETNDIIWFQEVGYAGIELATLFLSNIDH